VQSTRKQLLTWHGLASRAAGDWSRELAKLSVIYASGRVHERRLRLGWYRIGRIGVDILVNDPYVSARHAEMDVQLGKVVLTDLGSTNGTFHLEGSRVQGALEWPPNTLLRLGRCRLSWAWLEGMEISKRTQPLLDFGLPTAGELRERRR
jgi:pSer/pThr/pTyr-binding forkhead associated (FHA) protein